jgi:hypothetical protein
MYFVLGIVVPSTRFCMQFDSEAAAGPTMAKEFAQARTKSDRLASIDAPPDLRTIVLFPIGSDDVVAFLTPTSGVLAMPAASPRRVPRLT